MPSEARHLPTFVANEERLAWLSEIGRELTQRFPGKVAVDRLPGERPPTSAVRIGDRVFVAFGVIDATYFWTFDGGESCHYAKDKDVMRKLLTFEVDKALLRDTGP